MHKLVGAVLGTSLLLISAAATFAASDTGGGATSLTVENVIGISAPAGIDFGSAAPGDSVSINDLAVTVTTNNADGYVLFVQASDMGGAVNAGVVPATAMSFRAGTADLTALLAAATDLEIGRETVQTDADGTDYLVDAQLTVPWVAGDDYDGTVTFTASTL